MKKTKRWLLIFAALIGLMAHAGALRGTSVLYGKGTTTTTTTTTTEAPVIEEETQTPDSDNNTSSASASASLSSSSSSSSGPTLTGIPQIDYVWDPNLPRELNGYNLSEYPFYSTVPTEKEIGFKCDGLHDGFYASIKHKCQVYHHCIYGTRHDFLCANFTAFDQKTFICQFVSNVDCKNSAKYWHRNDALYMATTTTSTTTTTTPAPATQAPARRPGRPRRPLRRRRPSDYYYDEDYDEDYYEERINRRRKQRPRTRYPEYDDDYEERRHYSDDDRYEKRPMARDRHRDEEDDDMYESDRRVSEKPRNRNRSSSAGGRQGESDRPERRKIPAEKKRLSIIDRRPSSEERRSFIEDRDKPQSLNNDHEDVEIDRRPLKGRRRKNGDKRPSGQDDYERPRQRDRIEEEEDAETDRRDEPQDSRLLVKPSAPATSSLGSLFDRPRAPPKISRPVPLNEKRKFDYSSKAVSAVVTTTTSQPPEAEDYYDEEEYEDPVASKDGRDSNTRKSQSESRKPLRDRDEEPPRRDIEDEPIVKENNSNNRRSQSENQRKNVNREEQDNRRDPDSRPHRTQDESPRKSFHDQLRKQNGESQKPIEETTKTKVEERPERGPYRMRPISSIISRDDAKSKVKPENDPVDNEDSDYVDRTRDYRHRTLENSRKTNNRYKEESLNNDRVENQKKSQTSTKIEEDTDDDDRYRDRDRDRDRDSDHRSGERIHLPVELENKSEEMYVDEKVANVPDKDEEPIREARPIVRIVKRPFLPSRGGSPYLPRGLQAVGAAQKQSTTTDSTPIDMGSTISGVRLLEHGAPILRGDSTGYGEQHNGPRTTQKPQIEYPKAILDELYENEYDVTLNDALNPTLKPLTSSRIFPSGFTSTNNKFERNRYTAPANNPNSDSYYSSTDVHRRAVQLPTNNRQTSNNRGNAAIRLAHHFYDDYDY